MTKDRRLMVSLHAPDERNIKSLKKVLNLRSDAAVIRWALHYAAERSKRWSFN